MVASRKAKPIVRPRRRRATSAPGKASSADLKQQLADARAQQRASAEILKVIARSPTSAKPVFSKILQSCQRLFAGRNVGINIVGPDGKIHLAAYEGIQRAKLEAHFPVPLNGASGSGAAIVQRKVVHYPDVAARGVPDYARRGARIVGNRAVIFAPMLWRGKGVGAIFVGRSVAGAFSAQEIALLKSFADQAAIAIENVRRFNQTKEALERQTATAEILKVIAGSPADVQPVFDTIAERAATLCSARFAYVTTFDGEWVDLRATYGPGAQEHRAHYPVRPGGASVGARVIRDGAPVQIEDVLADPEYAHKASARSTGYRSGFGVPMVRDGKVLGAISLARPDPGPIPGKYIRLLQTFADQAVIAIENVRLFNETREALERQTATSEILSVISGSPTDIQPVLDAVASTAARLCEAKDAIIQLREGDVFRFVAHHGALPNLAVGGTRTVSRELVTGRAMLEGRQIHVHDLQAETKEYPRGSEIAREFDYRTILATPLMREGRAIGSIMIRRVEARPFTQTQLALMRTFADQAVIAIENVRLFNETREALERQTATAEILKVIAGSPSDVQPVFDTIVKSALALCKGLYANVFRYDGELLHFMATKSVVPRGLELMRAKYPMRPDASQASGRVIISKSMVRIDDVSRDPEYDPRLVMTGGPRRMLAVPMMRDGAPIGVVVVAWGEPGPILKHHEELLQTFADQAVIAIENVRLFNETREALERQTATAEILNVIASSPSDVQPVFDTIVRNFVSLCGSLFGAIFRYDGEFVHFAGSAGFTPQQRDGVRAKYPVRVDDPSVVSSRAILTRTPVHIQDILTDPFYDREHAATAGWRRMLAVPMLREGEPLGAIVAAWAEAGAIPKHHEELLGTFADQAVIAIENVRLFNETREALERQTATAEILKVIAGSPADVRPVFETIARSAHQLFDARYAVVTRCEDDMLHLVAHTVTGDEGIAALQQLFPAKLTGQGATGKAVLTGKPAWIVDVETDPAYSASFRANARIRGFRSQLTVPLMRAGRSIGAISVSRARPGVFSTHQVDLLQTFADQAVIAIENVRLFNETREALERQTATAEILKVISSSPTDTQPVFDAIVSSALRLFDGYGVGILLADGDVLHLGSVGGAIDRESARKRYPMPLNRSSVSGQAIVERSFINIADSQAPEMPELTRALGREIGYRSVASAPMMRDGAATGAITVMRTVVGAFSEKEVALLKTFADQAVIAVENVRLFRELQQRTESLTRSVGQLTALGEVGQAISSTLDLETVLQTIVSRAVQLSGMDAGSIYEYDEQAEVYRLKAAEKMAPELVDAVRQTPIRKGDGATGRTAVTLEPVQAADIQDASYQGSRKDNLMRTGYRAVLAVPLLREDHLLGALQVFRRTPGEFAPEVVELLKTFATQSAMAIQNARLFREIAEKGRQLEEASRHKSDFLASMSHELRTPLNAILGFNEMILGQVYGEVPADMKEPLEDIQKSGKHLLRLINNVLDLAKIEAGRMELSVQDYSVQDTVESVRATLRPLAAEKGLAFVASVPGDLPLARGDGGRIAQCLMNLAGNSLKFTKAGKVEINVTLEGDRLRFSVADTGIGIPADKVGGLFTEFKQTDASIASEYGGTGLGLSITKKFIEMHGGRIWVESQPGTGSTFRFEIPLRVSA